MSATGIAPQFFAIDVNSVVTLEDKRYRVTHLISVDTALAVDLESGESSRLPIELLRLAATTKDSPQSKPPRDLTLYSAEEWKEGQRRLQAIKGLLENPKRTREDAQKMAEAAGVHVATLYRWLAEFVRTGNVSSLVPATRGRKSGTRLLTPELEAIMDSVIEEFYLHKQRRTPDEVIEEVESRCRLAKVAPPHPNTIRNRIRRVPEIVKLKRRGQREEARNRFSPIQSSFDALHPFSVVMIDHTPVDIILVDEVFRQPIGRPYLTLAIDVFSRMVAGLYLSFDPPNSASVSLCLANAMCPKRDYLATLGIPGSWPVWGKIATVHVDNAKEFQSIALERGAQQHGIDLQWRPPATPNYGGHIERLMGTTMREVHKWPGTTFSNPQKRKGYDSEAESAMTLLELEVELVDFFVNKYHLRPHKSIGVPPIKKWERGITGSDDEPGVGLMPIPGDPVRLQIDFMPLSTRTIQRYGIQWDKITYYDPVLDSYINACEPDDEDEKQKYLVRRDPRDISKIYFYDPKSSLYVPLPYRNIGYPAMSLYELNEIRKRLADEGIRDVDESLIFERLERHRRRVAEAVMKSKTARRAQARSHSSAKAAPKQPAISRAPTTASANKLVTGSVPATVTTPTSARPEVDDIFAQQIKPFEELGMRR
ncbi:Mu transposase C-terminal domain-containing protein [Paucibacter sp. KCTC 42545]|uniref:Mu transposase C-terminal domain-containing protein n=1 Tax=Paucibacter sp. KCTC 42545 TaxID=1768242 RepID=UPI000733AC49|nr:Mu transposase C-terminal domain-containing protein [Paucibacter sp. KCTC 42545]ALT79290.1 urease subunit beta [Paucibacter sp. KCTC 42545]